MINIVLIFIFSLSTFIISLLGTYSYIAFISSILLFSSFDVIGYYYILTNKQTRSYSKKNIPLVIYRILQTIFQVLIILALIFFGQVIPALLFIFCWWLGTCDWLYYILTKQPYLKLENMFWLWWSLPGIIFKHNTSGKHLYLFSINSLIISTIILLFIHLIF